MLFQPPPILAKSFSDESLAISESLASLEDFDSHAPINASLPEKVTHPRGGVHRLPEILKSYQRPQKPSTLNEQWAREEATVWRLCLRALLDVCLRVCEFDRPDDVEIDAVQECALRARRIVDSDMAPHADFLNEFLNMGAQMARIVIDTKDELRKNRQELAESVKRNMTQENETQHVRRALLMKESQVAKLENENHQLHCERRALQNALQELKGNIRVFCRVRPPRYCFGSGLQCGALDAIRVEDARRLTLRRAAGAGGRCVDFSFDRIFDKDSGQGAVYQEVAPILESIFDGLNLCVFAYGQTGTGKTYTLSGGKSSLETTERVQAAGIQDMAMIDLLNIAQMRSQSSGLSYEAHLSAIEIYNECLYDLLATSSTTSVGSPLPDIRKLSEDDLSSPFGSLHVPTFCRILVRTAEDVKRQLQLIVANRRVAATALNEASSRSHCIISLSFTAQGGSDDIPAPKCGALHVIDLAGSERTKVSQAGGQQLKEANCINRSLSALADVLYALGEEAGQRAHIPYRNSKLTYLLQDALGGQASKTLLFANISPEDVDTAETHSTLTFASRVARVQRGRLKPSSPSPPRHRVGVGSFTAGLQNRSRSPSPAPGVSPPCQQQDALRKHPASFQADITVERAPTSMNGSLQTSPKASPSSSSCASTRAATPGVTPHASPQSPTRALRGPAAQAPLKASPPTSPHTSPRTSPKSSPRSSPRPTLRGRQDSSAELGRRRHELTGMAPAAIHVAGFAPRWADLQPVRGSRGVSPTRAF